jgi:hypothetical protein
VWVLEDIGEKASSDSPKNCCQGCFAVNLLRGGLGLVAQVVVAIPGVVEFENPNLF